MKQKNWWPHRLALISILTLIFGCFQNCGRPFESFKYVSELSLGSSSVVDGKALYASNCAACHGSLETSSVRFKSASQIMEQIRTNPQMAQFATLGTAKIELIASALNAGTRPPVIDSATGRQIFACLPGELQKTPLAKLTKREFQNSLNALLGSFVWYLPGDAQLRALMSAMPTDVLFENRNTLKEQPLLNTEGIVYATLLVADRAGGVMANTFEVMERFPGSAGCLIADPLTQACFKNFVKVSAERAFRRPLPAAEVDALAAALWDTNLSKPSQIRMAFAAIIMMPEFQFKAFDQGSSSNLGPNVIEMNPYALASKLSFFLTGAPPDAALLAVAADGTISNPTVLGQQVDRLMALPEAKPTVQRLFRESYGYDVYDSFVYPENFVDNGWLGGLREQMNDELDNYFVEVVLNQRGNFFQLMTSTSTKFASYPLQQIYGVGEGALSLPPERAGFLNRAAMLTKRSGYSASPIKRGLKVLEHVLCDQIGEPPPNAPTSVPMVTGELLSTRERTHRISEQPGTSCIACHSKINPLGYAFEKFDSFGRVRATERLFDSGVLAGEVAVNSQATSTVIKTTPVTFNDSAGLVSELGRSDAAMMCFVRQLKRFESGIPATDASNCQMNKTLKVLQGTSGGATSVADAVKSLVLAPEFRYWVY